MTSSSRAHRGSRAWSIALHPAALLVWLILPLFAGTGAAGGEPITIAEALCADGQTGRLDARSLVRHLLEVRPVPDPVLDADRDGDTMFYEKRQAILDPTWCARPEIQCSPEVAAAFADHRAALQAMVDDPRVSLERVGLPSEGDFARDPGLGPPPSLPDRMTPGELLDDQGRFIELSCALPEAGGELELVEDTFQPPGWVRDPDHDEGFRLTGEIDDLSKRRSEFATVKPAEFSISDNLLEEETTFFIDAVGGYHFDLGRGDEVRLHTIPFALLERLFSNDRDQVDKLGLGWQGSGRTPLGPSAEQEMAVTPVYFTDSDLETDIATLKFRWTPQLDPETGIPLGNVQQAGDLLVSTGIDLLSDAGHVFEVGANQNLLSEEEFLRLGGRLSLSVRGAVDTLFERIQFDLSEKYLYNLGSEIEHINLVEVAFSYLFPDIENYRLTFSFTGGRDDGTLVEKAFWKTQIGVRF